MSTWRFIVLAAAIVLTACPATHRYPDGSDLAGQLEREVVALQQRVRFLEHEVAHCSQDTGPDTIYQDLYALFVGSEVTVSRDGKVTILNLPVDYLFSGGTDLRDEARMALDLTASALKSHPDHQVSLEGHTDDRPPSGDLRRLYSDNWLLAYARAEAVMVALTQQFDVAPSRFTLLARAQHDPVATNDTSEGQRKNRRVVMRIIPPRRPVLPE